MGFGPKFSAPDPSLGYYRGAPVAGGGYGTAMGKKSGMTAQAAGVNTGTGTGAWHPTVKYMIAFVVVEIVAFAALGKLAGI